jgi:hypothetical protein
MLAHDGDAYCDYHSAFEPEKDTSFIEPSFVQVPADPIIAKEGKEFWDFVRKTAEEVSTWPECMRKKI